LRLKREKKVSKARLKNNFSLLVRKLFRANIPNARQVE